MTEVRRPAPPQPPRERWRQALSAMRARARPERGVARGPNGSSSDGTGALDGSLSWLLMLLGAALLIVAAVFAITSWRGRSAVPIDDQLPFLVGAEVDGPEPSPDADEADREASVGGAAAASEEAADVLPPDSISDRPADERDDRTAEVGTASPVTPVVVYVSGAVASPGVVELDAGARVHHAVDAVGGPTAVADLERVNLAALLVDGERIHVPKIGDDEPPTIVAPSRTSVTIPEPGVPATENVMVDINRASVAELEELPGVGPSIARAILDLRTARGDYASVDELLLVGGIGPTKLETLRPHAFVTGG